MSHYKSNLRDIEFNLFEVLRRQDLLGEPPYPELDEETARSILAELEKMATGPLAASFADADRNPPVFDAATNSVRVPDSLHASYRTFMDAEWYRLSLPAELGGTSGAAVAQLGHGRAYPRLQPGDLDVRQRLRDGPGAVVPRHRGAEALRAGGHRPRVGRHHGADRAGRGLRRGGRPAPGRSSSRTAPGTSRASSGSSPARSTTCPRTSSTSCWPGPRATAPAPRACPCSWCRSTWSTRTGRWASATACSPPTSSTRWA